MRRCRHVCLQIQASAAGALVLFPFCCELAGSWSWSISCMLTWCMLTERLQNLCPWEANSLLLHVRPTCEPHLLGAPRCRTQLTAGVDHAAAAPIIGRQLVSWAPGGGEQNHYRWQVAPARNYAESTDVRILLLSHVELLHISRTQHLRA